MGEGSRGRADPRRADRRVPARKDPACPGCRSPPRADRGPGAVPSAPTPGPERGARPSAGSPAPPPSGWIALQARPLFSGVVVQTPRLPTDVLIHGNVILPFVARDPPRRSSLVGGAVRGAGAAVAEVEVAGCRGGCPRWSWGAPGPRRRGPGDRGTAVCVLTSVTNTLCLGHAVEGMLAGLGTVRRPVRFRLPQTSLSATLRAQASSSANKAVGKRTFRAAHQIRNSVCKTVSQGS